MGKRSLLLAGILLAAAVPAASGPAEAILGEPAATVASDEKAVGAVRRAAKAGPRYIVEELTADATKVREYVNPEGIIFGIAWNGVTPPDLTPLLGSYAGEYEAALRQAPRPGGRPLLQVRGERVVVEKWGHMRNLQGRAYVPALVPPGVRVDEIR